MKIYNQKIKPYKKIYARLVNLRIPIRIRIRHAPILRIRISLIRIFRNTGDNPMQCCEKYVYAWFGIRKIRRISYMDTDYHFLIRSTYRFYTKKSQKNWRIRAYPGAYVYGYAEKLVCG